MIYMLKFSKPIGNTNHTAQYYLGYCNPKRLAQRIIEHSTGRGAAITRAAVERGIQFQLVLVIRWGTRQMERDLKNQKSHKTVLARFIKHKYFQRSLKYYRRKLAKEGITV